MYIYNYLCLGQPVEFASWYSGIMIISPALFSSASKQWRKTVKQSTWREVFVVLQVQIRHWPCWKSENGQSLDWMCISKLSLTGGFTGRGFLPGFCDMLWFPGCKQKGVEMDSFSDREVGLPLWLQEHSGYCLICEEGEPRGRDAQGDIETHSSSPVLVNGSVT